MLSQEFFTHYPSRLLWLGGGILSAFGIISGTLLLPVADQPTFPLPSKKNAKVASVQPLPSLHLDEEGCKPTWDLASLKDELHISLSPPRPDSWQSQPTAHVRVKGSGQSRRISLPGRVDLSFNDRGALRLQEGAGGFWMDLAMGESEMLSAKVSISSEGDSWCSLFTHAPDDPPLQKGDEFPSGSALRVLGETKWNGSDLVSQLGLPQLKQRLEIGSTTLDIGEKEWICWKEGSWVKAKNLCEAQGMPVAKIRSISPQLLEWDAWDETGSSHIRLATPLQAPSATIRIKAEELFSSVRIRSEKQISCTLEKQCFILRAGDWILKENGRWRILRKAEDRELLVCGKRAGELFILEKIDSKARVVKGRLFLANRTQAFPIELTATNIKRERAKTAGRQPRLGKGI